MCVFQGKKLVARRMNNEVKEKERVSGGGRETARAASVLVFGVLAEQ